MEMSDSPIVGRMVMQTNALLDVTGSTPIKLYFHEDGSVTWRPLYEAFIERTTE